MKFLQWPLAIAVIVGAIVLVTYEEHRACDRYQRDCQNHVSGVMSARNDGKTNSPDECQDPKKYMPWWYVLIAWPDGITVWALLATLGAIIWQSNETRRSANATADSANAAYGSVRFAEAQWRLMIEKERARLDIKSGGLQVVSFEGTEFWHLKATMQVRNIGASRLYITNSSEQLTAKVNDAPYPDVAYSPISFADSFIEPFSDFVELAFYFFPDSGARLRHLAEDLYDSRRTIYLYGFVDYETLGIVFRKEFGFSWAVTTPDSLMGALMGNFQPPDTDEGKITFGSWGIDYVKDKPEYPAGSSQPQNPD